MLAARAVISELYLLHFISLAVLAQFSSPCFATSSIRFVVDSVAPMGIFDEDDDGAIDAEADLEVDCFCDGPASDAALFESEGHGFMDLPPDFEITVSLPLAEHVETGDIARPCRVMGSTPSTPSPESATCAMEDGSATDTAGSDEYAASPPKKRIRLSVKTADKSTTASTSSPVLDEARFQSSSSLPKQYYPPIKFPSDTEWYKKGRKAQWQWVFGHVRSFWGSKTPKQDFEASDVHNVKQSHSTKQYGRGHHKRYQWSTLGPLERRAAAEEWLLYYKVPKVVALHVDAVFPPSGHVGHRLVGQTVLLNWVGPWGLKDSKGDWMSLPPSVALDALIEELKGDSSVKILWEKAQESIDQLRRTVAAQDVAFCLEVCPETFDLQRICRLHLHAYLRNSVRLRLPPSGHMKIDGALPQVSSVVGGMPCSRKSNSWSGYFYCVAPKYGQVCSMGSRRPFKDFLVDGKWIMNLVQASKLDIATARQLILKCACGARRFLDELSLSEKELERQTVQSARVDALTSLMSTNKPFKTFADVENWKAQYAQVQWRYKFLVLVGPSRTGKTQFARSLGEPAASLIYEVNCSSGQEPDMRAFVWSKHKLVLFDESHPKMVTQQRLLFQAGTQDITLGTSATNCHSYTVYCHQVRMVLCTNCWEPEVRDLVPGDREWLAANSIVVHITEPCWIG